MRAARVLWPPASIRVRAPPPVLLILLLVPLGAFSAPAPDRLGRGHDQAYTERISSADQGQVQRRQFLPPPMPVNEQAMTQTVVETVVQTMTETAYTVVVTASVSASSATPSPTSDSAASTSDTTSASSLISPATASGSAAISAFASVSSTAAPSSSIAFVASNSQATSAASASNSNSESASASAPPAVTSTASTKGPDDQGNVIEPTAIITQSQDTTTATGISSSALAPAPPPPSTQTPSLASSTSPAALVSSATSSTSAALISPEPSPTSAQVSVPGSSAGSTTSPASASTPASSSSGALPTSTASTPTDSAPADSPTFVADPSAGTSHAVAPQKRLMMAYYPDWTASTFPPEYVDFGRIDWVDFAFAVPTQQYGIGWDGDDDTQALLRRLVDSAHQAGKFVKLSVGGWTGSKYFSPAVSTPKNRQTFANNILKVYNSFGLDGIDIDWEFPGVMGNKGNIVNPNDSANFLAFLQVLRKTLPPVAKISAAVMTTPWADSKGMPMKDVSAFAGVLDWILVMNYDTWGSSSTPGPNAPLSNACHNSTQNSASAVAGIMSWTSAGFPASKIVLGVPSYGYISRSSSTSLITRSVVATPSSGHTLARRNMPMHVDPSTVETGPETGDDPDFNPILDPNPDPDPEPGSDEPAVQSQNTQSTSSSPALMVHNDDGGTDNGQVQFRDLVKQGALLYLQAWSSQDGSRASASNDTDGATEPATNAEGSSDSPADEGPADESQSDGDPLNMLSFAGRTIENVYNGQGGFVRAWDACSSSPFLRSASARQVVTYDDPQSLEMKAVFVQEAGMLGVNMFDVHGDTDDWVLVDALRRGLGLSS